MIKSLLARVAAAVVIGLAGLGSANAQNFDGNGIVRFGVFLAGEFYDVKAKPETSGSVGLDGAAIGFAAGFDYVFARQMLVGFEADLQLGDTTASGLGTRLHADYMATLRGRLGFYAMPQLLLYGTGGIAWAGLGIEDTIPTGGAGLDSNRTSTGWVAGGGIEYDFKDYFGTILFAEYLVGGFDSWTNPPGLGFDLDTDVQTFRLGLKFKVGHDYHADPRRGGPLK